MALIVAFVVALIATPVAARLATRLGVVDRPGPLKVHARPIPYLGGVAVFAGLAGPVAGARPSLLVPLGLACALGFADDSTGLTPLVRLVAEIGIGIAAAWVIAPHDAGHVVLGIVLVLVLANAVNMLDGLDGLATAVVAAGAIGFYVVLSGSGATLALALVGALLGFFVWNAPPPRVYLGDAGTYLLGTALAMLFLAAARYEAAVVSSAFLFVGVPVADAAVAIVRRARAGTALLRGDRGHVYDQLVDRGWSAKAAAAVCAAAQLVLTGIGIGVSGLTGGAAIAVAATVVVVVGAAAILTFTAPGAWTPDH